MNICSSLGPHTQLQPLAHTCMLLSAKVSCRSGYLLSYRDETLILCRWINIYNRWGVVGSLFCRLLCNKSLLSSPRPLPHLLAELWSASPRAWDKANPKEVCLWGLQPPPCLLERQISLSHVGIRPRGSSLVIHSGHSFFYLFSHNHLSILVCDHSHCTIIAISGTAC